MQLGVHSPATERLTPFEEDNSADSREANCKRHQRHDGWDESSSDSPMVEKEYHAELLPCN